jgi:iron(III) transport system substrate-binding protein
LIAGLTGVALAQSGKVTVYASQATTEDVVKLFEQKYPDIDVDLLHMVTGPLATRFSNEAETGVNAADVLIIATPSIFHVHPEWFLKLPEIGSAAYDAWPEPLKTDTYVRSTIGKAVVLYNTNLVPPDQAPKTWQDLLDPRYKGMVGLIDPSSSDTYMSWALNMRKAFGDQYLTDLGAQNPIVAGGGLDAAQAVASGAVAVSVPPFAVHATKLIEQGAPVGIANIGAPTLGNLTSIGLPAKAPNAENARLFFEFYLSPEGQSAACGGVSASGLGEGVPNCEPLPADFVPPSFDIPEADVEAILTLLGIRR